MIFPIVLALSAATPTQAIAHSMEDYTECLRVNAGRPDRQAAAERARLAIAQCRPQREAVIQLAIGLFAARASPEVVRTRLEPALASVDGIFPAVLAEGGGVEIPPPIAPMVRRYVDCLVEHIQGRGVLRAGNAAAYQMTVEASITACAAVRNSGLVEAEAVLSARPDFADADRRHEAINRAFDQTDAAQRNLPAILDAITHGQSSHASD